MPPKTVTCSVCSTEVLKAQTLARADGSRACRSHEGVQAEADKRAQDDQIRRAKAVEQGARPPWINDATAPRMNLEWEKEAAEFREYIHSHCWACAAEGLEWREFWTQALIAGKRLELRGEFNFMTYGQDVRKLMGNVKLLAPIKYQNEVTDRAVVKHLYKKVREIVHFIGFMLLCPECCDKHGFKQRLDDLFPKPTWEGLQTMSAAVQMMDPMLTAMAEKKEGQS